MRKVFLASSLVIVTMLIGFGMDSGADEPANAAVAQIDGHLSRNDDAYLNRQAGALLKEVEATLRKVPPQVPEPDERRLALYLLDAVLHDVYAPARAPVQAFYHARIEDAIRQMEAEKPDTGARIWKLYNHGFVVRTATVTLGFDLHRGPAYFKGNPVEGKPQLVPCDAFPISEALAARLAAQCDALFVSHHHADHVDEGLIRLLLEQGKPVVAPETVLKDTPMAGRITHLKREADTRQTLTIQGGARQLQVIVYPGQQYQGRGIPNNVVLVFTPEGLSFAHNGDQINDPYPQYQEDFKWSDKVHETQRVDVLMTNCWLNDPVRFVKGFDPKVVLPGHENELSHPMWDRVPYWGDAEFLQSNFPELKRSKYPVVTMTWGESYHYIPQDTK